MIKNVGGIEDRRDCQYLIDSDYPKNRSSVS